MSSNDQRRRSYSVGSFFNRRKPTYGLILPEEFEQIQNTKMRPKKTLSCPNDEEMDSRDCFVPTEMDTWELPQYQSLFQHLITNDGQRRPSSFSGEEHNMRKQDGDNKPGPIKSIQKWFREFVHSLKHDSEDSFEEDDNENDMDTGAAVEGIPYEMCEKLRYVHVYF